MSDTEKNTGAAKTHTGWTDKERVSSMAHTLYSTSSLTAYYQLVYLIGLLENTGTKLDYKVRGACLPGRDFTDARRTRLVPMAVPRSLASAWSDD
jgi:hypothetical protein